MYYFKGSKHCDQPQQHTTEMMSLVFFSWPNSNAGHLEVHLFQQDKKLFDFG